MVYIMKVKVSVICLVYNHGKYLRDTLEAFVNQKTSFDIEFIIHDDASTDDSIQIIKEYESKYPNLIKPIYEEINQYQLKKFPGITTRIINSIQSDYIAFCEGDDYWCDDYKLQKQVDYMDSHPDCSLYLHNGYYKNAETGKMKKINPYKKIGILETNDVLNEIGKIPPTASMLFKTSLIKDMPMEILRAPVGDRPRRMYLATVGDVYYSNECMCVYRINNKNSFSGRLSDYEKSLKLAEGMKEYYERFDKFTEYKYHDSIEFLKSMEYTAHYSRFGELVELKKEIFYQKRFSLLKKIKAHVKYIIKKLK